MSTASPPGRGDLAAFLALLVFALLATSLWITTPDFVFHWGIKGERYFLTRGIDWRWLSQSWNWSLHPDYPPLLPLLYGSTAALAGRFEAPTLQLWSVLATLGIAVAAREGLVRAGLGRGAVQVGTAWVGLLLAAFSILWQMAGGADALVALALAAALPTFLTPRTALTAADDLAVAVAAAFAAGSKMEGLPLAAILLFIHLLRRFRARPAVLAAALPTVAIVLPWLIETRRWHLFQASNSGPFDLGRAAAVLPAMADALSVPVLKGLPWTVLLLPLAWLLRRTRALAAVLTLQLGFLFWVYLASSLEPRFYVLTSFARLVFQLLPAVVVGAVAVVAVLGEGYASGEGERQAQRRE